MAIAFLSAQRSKDPATQVDKSQRHWYFHFNACIELWKWFC